MEGNSFYDSVFIDFIKEKKNKDTPLSDEFNMGDRIIVNVNGGDVVAQITGIEIHKDTNGTVNKNISKITYRYANGDEGTGNWWTVKVSKDTPLSSPKSFENKKKYTLEDDSRYRFKYAKYKAKYVMYKNNLHNN